VNHPRDPEHEFELDDLDPNTFDLGEIRAAPDDRHPASPVTSDPQSLPETPETPEQPRRMTEASGTGGTRSHILTTEMLQTLLAACNATSRSSHPKLRDPEPFDGEQVKLQRFLAHCELKFRTEGSRFDDDEEKTGYTGALFIGIAWSWLEPLVTQTGGLNLIWEEFKVSMGHVFDEVDTEEVAYEKFQKIQQWNRTAAAYWANF